MKEPTALELIKWCFKETYRASRLKRFALDYKDNAFDLLIQSLWNIWSGIVGGAIIILFPLIALFCFIKMLLCDPIILPIVSRESVLKLKEKWEKEL